MMHRSHHQQDVARLAVKVETKRVPKRVGRQRTVDPRARTAGLLEPASKLTHVSPVLIARVRRSSVGFELDQERVQRFLECGLGLHEHMEPQKPDSEEPRF